MIDILNNPNKNFKLKKAIKTWIYPLNELPADILLKPSSIELGANNSTVCFHVSKDNNIDSLTELIKNTLLKNVEKEQKKKKALYEKIIKAWDENPKIFKKQIRSYSKDTYTCSNKKLFTNDEYSLAFSTGCGSYTFYHKTHFVELLKKWDKYCLNEIKEINKETKTCIREILNTDIEINSTKLDDFLSLEESNTSTKRSKAKPKFPFVFNPDSLNLLLSETGGDFVVDDDIIEDIEEKDKKLASNLKKIKGAVFSTSHEGEHYNDGQICDYTVAIIMSDNNEYYAYDSHCLMTGWNFSEPVKFK